MKRSLKAFQQATDITTGEHVVNSLLNTIGETARHRVPGLSEINGETPLENVYMAAMNYHLKKNLGLSDRAANLIKAYLNYRSFGLMKEASEILAKSEKSKVLLREPRVLLAPHDNLRAVLENGEEMRIRADISLWDMACHGPLLLLSDLNNVFEVTSVLLEYDAFTLDSLVSCHRIFMRISAEQCKSRLEALKTDPIWLYRKCSRFPYLLLYKTVTVMQRLEFIRKASHHRDVMPHEVLLPEKAAACRLLGMKVRHRSTKYLTARVLETELGNHAEKAMQLIRDHPLADQVELSLMCDTAKFLKQRYSLADIAHNAQLLLHSCTVVAKVLDIVRAEYTQERGYAFTGYQQLTTCHYLLERCASFNGNSIFFKDLPEDFHLPHLSKNAS